LFVPVSGMDVCAEAAMAYTVRDKRMTAGRPGQ